jgi:hypothetical protein
MFYGECILLQTLGTEELAGYQDNTPSHTSFFTREFFTKNNMTVILHPPYLSLFPQLQVKMKGDHFYTIEVIKAESQAHTEHDFQDVFKKMADM